MKERVYFSTDAEAQQIISQKQAEGLRLALWADHEDGRFLVFEKAPADVFAHISITGGDGLTPPGICNDGVNALDISLAIRSGPMPDSPLLPISGTWRILIRSKDGPIYDIVSIQVTDGLGEARYTTTLPPCECTISEDDFDQLEYGGASYRVRLASPVAIKVYRTLS